ncbi:MAG: HAMP domain-containing histidine kinase [Planctomycetales bacterium]|nr:HAMP domain-containing histidine kinase [Planctomycetales bacterium]
MLEDLESHDYRHDVLAEQPIEGVTVIQEHEWPHINKLLKMRSERQAARAKQAREKAKSPRPPADEPRPAPPGAAAPVDGKEAPAPTIAGDTPGEPRDEGFLRTLLHGEDESEPDEFSGPIATDAITYDREGQQHYAYYQLVDWRPTCVHCHSKADTTGALTAADAALLDEQDPLRVVRVIFPHQWSDKQSVNRIRAILTSASILTFFVAMVALYVIVRYVIVKPLQHLRDVSDEISRGETQLRAEIHTNDEFEDLADSFNRMLRHLTDTQQNLRGVNKTLDAKVDELAQLNMQLYEMNRVKSDFLANMSHELRTPLNSIIGFSEVLSGIDSLTDKQKRYAQNIQNSGRVLLEMINDILDLAKVESGMMELRLTEFRIDSIVNAQCDMVRSLTEEKNIDLIVEVDDGIELLYQDQGKVQQILTNLLSNAIKFTPEGGRINVHAGPQPDGRLMITVEDTGVGIPEEDREIIFEKFRQSKSMLENGLTREYSGTGLGLSIVKELCKLLGGEIDFESEVGKGSRFLVWLPMVAPPSSDQAAVAPARELNGQPGGDGQGAVSRW